MNKSPILNRSNADEKENCCDQEEVNLWTTKILWIWAPARIAEVRRREGNLGILFVVELSLPLRLHLGIGRKGVDFCHLWHDDQGVLWDYTIGFCSAQPHAQTMETDEHASQMQSLIRRNCYLLGAPIEVTREEKRAWIAWLAHRALEKA